ncbi:MAG: ribosomal-processing cysteine protease Prp [Bacilli bacterium]
MINITIKKESNIITEVLIKGHSNYCVSGKDIVCASVSSILITTVNAIISFDKEAIKYNETNDFALINLKKDNITNTLIDNMINLLYELENTYRKNIKIKEE